ncbi:retrovirus-related Pol polyprotein from transposon TNT 1-94 [Trichonephila clavipes]|nr:retrovirus-related Pol polyprotein from transposon TNT 1-94 [Trichonephila clavipes]
MNIDYLVQTSKVSAVNGSPKFKNEKLDCESCKLAKSKRISFKPIGRIRSTRPLQLVHRDVCGPLPVVSSVGAKYFLSITHGFSRMVTCFPLKEKSQVFEYFKSFQANAERVLNCKILSVRCDNGMEFCPSKFSKHLNELGIKFERTNTYTHEQNGVSERFNVTAMDCVKAMLNTSGIEKCFGAEAEVCFTYVKNRICHKFKDKTPYQLYFGRKPTVSHLKVFGCHFYVGTPKQLRKELDLRTKHGIMLGYACSTRGYRIWLLDKKLIETCNVLFDESKRVSNGILNFPSSYSRKMEWMEFKFNNPFNTFSYDGTDKSGKAVVGNSSRVNTPVENASNLKLCSSIPFYREAVLRQNGKRGMIFIIILKIKMLD